ncbi:MAG: hypothetical protein AAGF60_00580 [Pseudomonadota bacterium]
MGRLAAIICLALWPVLAQAQNASNPHYPVVVLDRTAGIIGIVDEVDFRLPLSFERVLETVPAPKVLILDSPGGSVHAALAVAARVSGLGMATEVAPEGRCYSACSMIFFAGETRNAKGALGVHQISSDAGSLEAGQFALADIIEVLDDFGVPTQVVAIMLRTPMDEIYVFDAVEKARFGFDGSPRVDIARGVAAPSPVQPLAPAPAVRPTAPVISRQAEAVDLTDPQAWIGKTITGELISNGKRWYSALGADGRTTFVTTSGKRLTGTFQIRAGAVCYLYDSAQSSACRTPVRVGTEVRWLDEKGAYVSRIVAVDDSPLPAPPPPPATRNAAAIAEAIAPGTCALIVAERATLAEAQAFVVASVEDTRFVQGFLTKAGLIAVSVGLLKPEEVAPVMEAWTQSGRIPADSFCSDGSGFVDVVTLAPA